MARRAVKPGTLLVRQWAGALHRVMVAADVKTKSRGRAIVTGGKGTATRTMALVGTVLTHAVEEGYRLDNPDRGIVLPSYEKRKVHLDADQYAALGRAPRMTTAYQNGLVTLDRLRSRGKQTIVVQHVQVNEGGASGCCRQGERGRQTGRGS